MRRALPFLMGFFSLGLFSASLENQIQIDADHFVHYLSPAKRNFVNWSGLFYYSTFTRDIGICKEDNFIQKYLFEQRELIKESRKQIYRDILAIDINNEITVKELLEISSRFQQDLTRKFFSAEILLPAGQVGYQLNIGAFFPFAGKDNLIPLILRSGYFIDREKLEPVKSHYQPFAYEALIIEARHLDLKPALFPNLYTFDEAGNLQLIYSLAHSNTKAVMEMGYIRYYRDLKSFDLKNRKNYYCPALKVSGTKEIDLVISREDYIKFFASPVSLKNLSEGRFFVIGRPKEIEKKTKPELMVPK